MRVPDIKFCGLMREDDARLAGDLGARYAGVIRAGGPRHLDVDSARAVLDHAGPGVHRVAVFGAVPAAEIAEEARELSLDVIQLHADPGVGEIEAVRGRFGGIIWAVLRLDGAVVPPDAADLAASADGLVLDRRSAHALGGTGEKLPWAQLADQLDALRDRATIVVAGGLRPENVTEAMRHLRPDVLDVSSGVESAAGVKDHGRMRAFAAAVAAGEAVT